MFGCSLKIADLQAQNATSYIAATTLGACVYFQHVAECKISQYDAMHQGLSKDILMPSVCALDSVD